MTGIQKEPKRKAKNLQYIRMANRAEVIHFLAVRHEATRLTLAEHLGLTKMAISNIVGEMLSEGLVIENAARTNLTRTGLNSPALTDNDQHGSDLNSRSQSGRKSTLVKLDTDRYMAIGVYISRDELQGVTADISGRIHKTWRQPLDIPDNGSSSENGRRFTNKLLHLIDTIIADNDENRKPGQYLGIGVCCIGPLDLKEGVLLAPPNFHNIEQIELLSLLGKRYQLPVRLDNDMNAAAWGEHLYGAGQNCQHVVYLGLTNGIGAGIISYGRILQGSEGFGGELGHMSIQMDGPLCSCGQRGCLELYTSVPVILQKTKSSDLETLLQKSRQDELFRQSWLPSFRQAMVTGLVNLANIFDPDIILIGHEGAAMAELILTDLEENTNLLAFQHRSKKIPVRLAKFKEKAPLIGAASLIFQAVFRGELGAGQDHSLS